MGMDIKFQQCLSYSSQEIIYPLQDQFLLDESYEISLLSPTEHFRIMVVLSICTLTHSYLIISTFPYITFMPIHLLKESERGPVDEENAGLYAALIFISFFVGRACTSYAWGIWADIYGRKSVLCISLWFSCLFTLLFGTAPTFQHVIFFRFLLGLCNGILGTTKTIVFELAGGSHSLETSGMKLVMGMWGWGLLFFPLISGALTDPVRQYPSVDYVQKYQDFLETYPFFLPNAMGAFMCAFSALCVSIIVIEPLPTIERRSSKYILYDFVLWLINSITRCIIKHETKNEHLKISDLMHSHNNYLTDESFEEVICKDIQDTTMTYSESCSFLAIAAANDFNENERFVAKENKLSEVTMFCLWSDKNIRTNLMIYWLSSFLCISLELTFLLFCMSRAVGLGLREVSIGNILSFGGLIFVSCQYFIFPMVIRKFGLNTSIILMTILLIPVVTLIPLSFLFNKGMETGTTNHKTIIFLGFTMAANRIFGNILFSGTLMTVNQVVPANHRRVLNNLLLLGGSCVKVLAPLFAGALVASIFPWKDTISSQIKVATVYSTLGILQIAVAIATTHYLKQNKNELL